MSVIVLMGSDNDLEQVKPCLEVLKEFSVPFKARVLSAHRTPEELHKFIEANDEGTSVYIAAAGGAAHLGGVIASLTCKPVIGIPILSTALAGADSLYSFVQMPGGIPVATMGIGKGGAKNAGLLAVQILGVADSALHGKMKKYRNDMKKEVADKDAKLQKKLKEDQLI